MDPKHAKLLVAVVGVIFLALFGVIGYRALSPGQPATAGAAPAESATAPGEYQPGGAAGGQMGAPGDYGGAAAGMPTPAPASMGAPGGQPVAPQ